MKFCAVVGPGLKERKRLYFSGKPDLDCWPWFFTTRR